MNIDIQTITEKRNDEIIRDAVIRELAWLPTADIQVSARDGAVTLTGFVNGRTMKLIAEESAKSVFGVRSVANHIDTMPITDHPCPEDRVDFPELNPAMKAIEA